MTLPNLIGVMGAKYCDPGRIQTTTLGVSKGLPNDRNPTMNSEFQNQFCYTSSISRK